MGALARLSLLKSAAFLNELTTTFDNELKFILEDVTDFVELYCGRILESTTYTDELYTGDDTDVLFLKAWPVTTLSTVKLWDGSSTYATETATYYALINQRYIQYPALGQDSVATWSKWQSSYRNGIKVTYTAGYRTGTTYAITGVSIANDTFTILGDYTSIFTAGKRFDVISSTGNNGTWTVTSSSLVAGSTVIIVTGNITNAFVDGTITASWSAASIADSLFDVPRDLEYAVAKLAALAWLEGKGGDGRLGTGYKQINSIGSEGFIKGIPDEVKMVLDAYRTNPI